MSKDATHLIPAHANPQGPELLPQVLEALWHQWRRGGQIAVLIGSGLSQDAGYPALRALAEHLLALRALGARKVSLRRGASVPLYTPAKHGWLPPAHLSDFLEPNRSIRSQLDQVIKSRFADFRPQRPPVEFGGSAVNYFGRSCAELLGSLSDADVTSFAWEVLGMGWMELLSTIADHRPQLVEALFDEIGVRVKPSSTYTLLAHCASLLNIRLLLTTNFDTLIDDALQQEGLHPYVYDVHISAPPPPADLVRQHLAIVKLHGSRYGLRADNSILTPLDMAHQEEMLRYFERDAMLLVLGYGGGDRRVMDLLRHFVDQKAGGEGRRIIRLDPFVPGSSHKFLELAAETRRNDARYAARNPDASPAGEAYKPPDRRVVNIYYPNTGSFFLELYQYCAESMPYSRMPYTALPQLPAPHRVHPMLGRDALADEEDVEKTSPALASAAPRQRPYAVEAQRLVQELEEHGAADTRLSVGIVAGRARTGVSQYLAHVYESLEPGLQALWCDLDEAVSLGTLANWIHRFVSQRQPDLPTAPPPLDLPDQSVGTVGPSDVISIRRTTEALWERLSRGKYLLVIDSFADALSDVCSSRHLKDVPHLEARMRREAARLLLFVAALLRCSHCHHRQSGTVILVGTHFRKLAAQELVGQLRDECLAAIRDTPELSGCERDDLVLLVWLLAGPSENQSFSHWRRDFERARLGVDWITETKQESVRQFRLSVGRRKLRYELLTPHSGSEQLYGIPAKPEIRREILCKGEDAVWDFKPAAEVVATLQKSAGSEHPQAQLLWAFLIDAHVASRPRSWLQLGYTPALDLAWLGSDATEASKGLADEIRSSWPKEEQEDRFAENRIARIFTRRLVKIAQRADYLRRLPGGFFWMDRGFRAAIEEQLGPADQPAIRLAHTAYRRYFERLYTQSGDAGCLNAFMYHSMKLMEQDWVQLPRRFNLIFESTSRCLLENAAVLRVQSGVYDHTFSLLRLLDIHENALRRRDPAVDVAGDELFLSLREMLREFYDDAQVIPQLTAAGKPCEPLYVRYDQDPHEQQKSPFARLSFEDTLHHGCQAVIQSIKSGWQGQAPPDPEIRPLLEAMRCAWNVHLDGRPHLETDTDRDFRLDVTEESRLYHTRLLRLARNCVRTLFLSSLHDEGMPLVPRELLASLTDALSVGMRVLDVDTRDRFAPRKSLWCRYRVNLARTTLARTVAGEPVSGTRPGRADYVRTMPEVYNHLKLARAYAGRDSGPDSEFSEALVCLHEAEALLWEARFIMCLYPSRPDQFDAAAQATKQVTEYREADARQVSALAKLAESADLLGQSRRALSWWREHTLIYAGVNADIAKLAVRKWWMQTYPLSQAEPSAGSGSSASAASAKELADTADAIRAIWRDSARKLERAARVLAISRAVIWNDPWRECKLQFEMSRLRFYVLVLLFEARHLLCPDDRSPCWSFDGVDEGRQAYEELTSATVTLLRALTLLTGDAPVSELPDGAIPRSADQPGEELFGQLANYVSGHKGLSQVIHPTPKLTDPTLRRSVDAMQRQARRAGKVLTTLHDGRCSYAKARAAWWDITRQWPGRVGCDLF